MLPQTIGFIGAGQMAQALARGFVAARLVEGRQIVVADPVASAIEAFIKAVPGVEQMPDNRRIVERSEIVLSRGETPTGSGGISGAARSSRRWKTIDFNRCRSAPENFSRRIWRRPGSSASCPTRPVSSA